MKNLGAYKVNIKQRSLRGKLDTIRRIDVTHLPDVTKAIAVKSNKYTTWHISKGGRFFAF